MADDPRAGRPTGFSCHPATDAARFVLCGREPAFAAARGALGIEQPPALRVRQNAGRELLRLGPEEYLLLAPAGEADTLAEMLEVAMAGHPHSLVEVSDRQIGFDVSGLHIETVLNVGCALDLAVQSFPVGMCTRTLFGKAEITLWRLSGQRFRVEVWRSFAPYFETYLRLAARGALA